MSKSVMLTSNSPNSFLLKGSFYREILSISVASQFKNLGKLMNVRMYVGKRMFLNFMLCIGLRFHCHPDI